MEIYFTAYNHKILLFPHLIMVLPKEKWQLIIYLHQNGVSTQDIVAKDIALQRTLYRLIKTYKETGSLKAKKTTGRKKSTSDRDDKALIRNCLLN